MKVALNEKWKKLLVFSFYINIGNFEVFLRNLNLSAKHLFWKCVPSIVLIEESFWNHVFDIVHRQFFLCELGNYCMNKYIVYLLDCMHFWIYRNKITHIPCIIITILRQTDCHTPFKFVRPIFLLLKILKTKEAVMVCMYIRLGFLKTMYFIPTKTYYALLW